MAQQNHKNDRSLVILLVTANVSFQTVPAESLVGDAFKPEPAKFVQESPRVMAERNPVLTDEIRGELVNESPGKGVPGAGFCHVTLRMNRE